MARHFVSVLILQHLLFVCSGKYFNTLSPVLDAYFPMMQLIALKKYWRITFLLDFYMPSTQIDCCDLIEIGFC